MHIQTSMASKSKFDDLDLSQDEIKRIGDALKDEQFRKLFVEYAEEISDPENRKRYEEEIRMLENEKGMNVEFVNPQPGYVLKTSAGEKKAFINICTSDKIGKPESSKQTNADGKRGLAWRIPHSFSPPREDLDKNGRKCMVYDVVFHPDTYRMSDNPRFKQMMEDTAFEGIQRQFDIKVDTKNVKRPKLKYKGAPVATVIRTRNDGAEAKKPDAHDPLKGMPYPYGNLTSEEKANLKNKDIEKKEKDEKLKASKTKTNIEERIENKYTKPNFRIIHRSDLELQQYTNAPDSRPTTRPKELVITVELPLLKSAAGVDLDIFEERMMLTSEKPAYKLDMKLPYPVDDTKGGAKFDKLKRCLIVTLPVIPGEVPKMPSFIDDKQTENGHVVPETPPLIEELPPLEDLDEDDRVRSADDLPPLEDIEDENRPASPVEDTSAPKAVKMPDIAYTLPAYDYSQDTDTATFVFHVRNVTFDSIVKRFPEPSVCLIRFVSLGMGGFPIHYSFYLRFSPDCKLVSEHCTLDTSEKNVTFTLLKDKGCRGLWNKFEVGLDETLTEEKIFVTETSLQLELDKLEADATMVQTSSLKAEQPNIQVTEMNHKKLTININKTKGKEKYLRPDSVEDCEADDECPSSADIQVIHGKTVPNLHGILKQRSISESSEDHNSASSESPVGTSPRDPEGFKKSVSFNSHVDKTSYKSSASVNSMKATLKSKRKRNRKREEKQRRRHNSNGSEGSSCDDMDMRSAGSSESHSEDDHDDLAEQISATNQKVVNSGVIEEEDIVEETKPEETKAQSVAETKESGADSKTSVKTSSAEAGEEIVKHDKKSKLVEEVKSKLVKHSCDEVKADDSDDDLDEGYRTSKVEENDVQCDDENAQKEVGRTKGGNGASKKVSCDGDEEFHGRNGSNMRNGLQTTSTTNGKAAMSSESGEEISVNSNAATTGKRKSGKKKKKGKKASVTFVENEVGQKDEGQTESESVEACETEEKVETVLDWNESEKKQKAEAENEHKTECAFKFSNDVMFDLDVD